MADDNALGRALAPVKVSETTVMNLCGGIDLARCNRTLFPLEKKRCAGVSLSVLPG